MASKNSRILIWIPVLLSIAAALGVIIGYNFNPRFSHSYQLIQEQKKDKVKIGQIGRIEEIIRFIEHSYVDTVDTDELTTHAINEVLSQLDPFSSYISKEDLESYNDQLDGIFKGIGINYIQWNDSIYILDVLPNSPAERKKLKRGDVLLSINGDTVSGAGIEIGKIREDILSQENEKLAIDFKRPSIINPMSIDLEIAEIPLQTSKSAYAIDEKTIYIKIDRFSSTTFKQFIQALEKLNLNERPWDLIIDLRDNPGGYLPETIKILSQFFEEKQALLSFTEGAKRKRKEYKSNGHQYFKFDKLAVLINQNSASGSEIIAGALQDWDKALIVGETSFGKGLVQEIHPLKNGGAIRITVAKYMTPSGRSIQKKYLLQDSFVAGEKTEFESQLYQRKLNGGGGIEPDIYIPEYNPYKDCQDLNLLSLQAYLLKYYPLTSPYSDYDICSRQFEIRNEDFETYRQFLNNNDLPEIENECFEAFRYTIKRNLINYWYSELERQMYVNSEDPVVKSTLDALEGNNLQALLTDIK